MDSLEARSVAPVTPVAPNAPGVWTTNTKAPKSLLLVESQNLVGGPVPLFHALTAREQATVLSHGQRRVVYRGKMLFSQGAAHEGIYFIETGRIRVFYIAPSGREITLAYWNPGNFVGGPDVFGPSVHMWSGVATQNASVVHLPGKALKTLVTQIPSLAIGLIEGLSFKGKCYSALAQMLGTRSVTERLAHLLLHLADAYGVPGPDGVVIGSVLTHADIAHMVGATRQWVTISLKRLQTQGILTSAKSQIVIHRPNALAGLRGNATESA
jgi:CRP/FNR family cyclic AMP-dependent transcriptional regulator